MLKYTIYKKNGVTFINNTSYDNSMIVVSIIDNKISITEILSGKKIVDFHEIIEIFTDKQKNQKYVSEEQILSVLSHNYSGYNRLVNHYEYVRANTIGVTYAISGLRKNPTKLHAGITIEDFGIVCSSSDSFMYEIIKDPSIFDGTAFVPANTFYSTWTDYSANSGLQKSIINSTNNADYIDQATGLKLVGSGASNKVTTSTQSTSIELGMNEVNDAIPAIYVLCVTPLTANCKITSYINLNENI